MLSNEEKGGYDVEFVGGKPKNVTCSICLFVLREPMQAEQCGHRFCKSCIEDLKENSENESITCPQDRIVSKVFRDRGKERDILDCLIKCTNGCQWTCELRDLEKHNKNCEYQLVSCENEGCGEEVQRRYLLQHMNADCSLRNVNCEYCKMVVKFCHLEEHNQVCVERPIQCSRCKSKNVPKHLMSQHLEKECPMIDCEYSDIGCQETVKRDCMSFHKENSTEIHLDCVISKVREQENQLQEQRNELDRQSATINRQKEQLEQQQSTITALHVQMNEILGKFSLQAHVNENQAGMLKDVNDKKEKMGSTTGKLDSLQPLVETFRNELVWVIDNFNRKFEDMKRENNSYKKTFFTQKGYKCKAELFLNGHLDRKGKYVSLYLGLVEGPFDDTLIWPMDATIYFCVLKNGLEKKTCRFFTTSNEVKQYFKRPKSGNSQWGSPNFIPHNSISNFIVDDTVTFKILVE